MPRVFPANYSQYSVKGLVILLAFYRCEKNTVDIRPKQSTNLQQEHGYMQTGVLGIEEIALKA
jgi:hypothetical protein